MYLNTVISLVAIIARISTTTGTKVNSIRNGKSSFGDCSEFTGTFIPVENNCMNYYLCIDGKLVLFTCGEGNYLQVEDGYCTQDKDFVCNVGPDAAQKTCSSEQNGFFLPSEECYKYQFCVDGLSIPLECPVGQYFNEEIEYCIADTEETCNRDPKTTTEKETTTDEPTTTTEEPISSTEEPTSTASTTTEVASTASTKDSTISTEKPTTTEEPITSTEEPITSTEEPITSTEEPITSTEEPITSTEKPKTSTEEPITSTEEPITSTEEPITSTEKPKTSTEETITSTEEPITSTEEPTTTTEEPTTTTEEPTTTTKEPTTTTEEPTTTTEEPTTTTEEPTTTTEEPTTTTTEEPSTTTVKSENICEGIEEGYVPHEDCDKFYMCTDGVPTVQVCSEGDYFDPTINRCTFDKNGVCLGRCKDVPSGTRFPDENNCQSYFECQEGFEYAEFCQEGYYFDGAECVEDVDKICGSYNPTICQDQTDGTIIAHGECGSYYLCKNNEAQVQNCNNGYLFAVQQSKCVLDPTFTCFCQDNAQAVFASNDSCNEFYTCANEKATVQKCPQGEYFEPTELKCIADENDTCLITTSAI